MKESITVKCPSCSHQFPLSDGVLSSVRDDLSRELQSAIAKREEEVRKQRDQLAGQQEKLKEQEGQLRNKVREQVEAEIGKKELEIRKEAEKRALKMAEEAGEVRLKALQEDVEEKSEALKKARAVELELQREKRRLGEEKEALALEVERKLNAERDKLKESIMKRADEQYRLQIAEREKQMEGLKKQLDEAQRKAEQGSMQTQGDVLEIDLENRLRQSFPMDRISPVSTGVRGADVMQEVIGNLGRPCGTIIFETKRTKNWSNDWCAKLKNDMREARADIAILISEALPDGIEQFGEREGVWVSDYQSAIPLVQALRYSLHEVMLVKGHQQGAKQKQELLYDYLTGNDFRQRVQAVIDSFTSMREDLEREKRALTKYWSKREKQLGLVVDNMSGMFGDVQALSGNALEDIPALDFEDDES